MKTVKEVINEACDIIDGIDIETFDYLYEHMKEAIEYAQEDAWNSALGLAEEMVMHSDYGDVDWGIFDDLYKD